MVHSTTCFLTLLAVSALTIHGAPMKARANLDDGNTATSKFSCPNPADCDDDDEFQSNQALSLLCTQDPTNPACAGGTSQANPVLDQICAALPTFPGCKNGKFVSNDSLVQKCIQNPNDPACINGVSQSNPDLSQTCTQNPKQPSCPGDDFQHCDENAIVPNCGGKNGNVGGIPTLDPSTSVDLDITR